MERDTILLCTEDFEAFPEGRIGTGAHGEPVLGGKFLLGYCRTKEVGDDLHAAVRTVDGDRRLHVVDRRRGTAMYVRLGLGVREGVVSFDFEMPRVRPLTISLCAYQVVLTIPDGNRWKEWFGERKYRTAFVYLEGTGAGYNPHVRRQRGNYAAVATGVVAEPNKRYRITIEWEQRRRTASVTIDGKEVIDRRRYLSNVFRDTESVCWSTASFGGYGMNDNSEFYIDDIEARAKVWRQR